MKRSASIVLLAGVLLAAFSQVVFHRTVRDSSRFAAPRSGYQSSNPGRTVSSQANAGTSGAQLVESYGKLPLSFEVNQGQADAQVKFLSRGKGYALFLTGEGAVLSLRANRREASADLISQRTAFPGFVQEEPRGLRNSRSSLKPVQMPESESTSVIRMKLAGSNPNAKVVGLEELPGQANYFIGNNPRKWRTNVATFAKVKYKSVYPGVDLVYYGNQGQLEYDFVVAPGADPNAITLAVEAGLSRHERDGGARPPLQIAADGDFVIRADGGEVRFHKPVVFQPSASPEPLVPSSGSSHATSKIQNRKYLNAHYVLTTDDRVHFEVPGYDTRLPLIIDPVLSYSTYLGGNGLNNGTSIAVDASGNAYVTGFTESVDFPTMNPLQAACGGSSSSCVDAFVAKLNAAGTALLYSTFLGGSGQDRAFAIALDSSGNAYVMGGTTSTDFPTVNPFQATNHGGPFGSDDFVAKLNATGSALVYSTYLGGSGDESTPGFVQVTTINQGAIAVDSLGNAYVAGYTNSTDFPTANPIQAANAGGFDAFVVKFNASGTGLVYSTYLGGSSNDAASGIAVDSLGNAYVAGTTFSTNFPTASPFQPANAGNNDAFVAKLNASGSALVYSSYLGGSSGDVGGAIALDSAANAYITGTTGSTDFPTMNPFMAKNPASQVAFVTKINAAGSAPAYSTYLGGSFDEGVGTGIAVDSSGNAYVTGVTLAADFPTANPIQASYEGNHDDFVTVFNPSGSGLLYSTYLGGSGEEVGGSIAIDSSGNAYVTGATTSADFPTLNPLQPTCGAFCDAAFIWKISPANAAAVSLAPAGLNFPDQFINTTSAPQTLVLRDVGSAALTISNISITGTNSGDFALASNNCGAGLSGGGSCSLTVTFTPTLVAVETADITVTDNASGSPHTATLTGKGVNPPVVTLSPTSLNFGQQLVGTTSATMTVTVTNTGGSTLSNVNWGFTGTNAGDFNGLLTCPGTEPPVPVGDSCKIDITFTPAGAGARSAQAFINDNAPGGPQTIPLSGIGIVDYGMAVAAGTSSTATVTAGQSPSYTLVVTPQQAAVNQTVMVKCTGAPTAATCTPSPASLTLNGTTSQNITVTVSTTARGMLPPNVRPRDWPWNPIELLLLACIVALMIVLGFTRARRLRPQPAFALLLICLISLASLAACGGGSSTGPPPPTGTPAGTYTLTITGTSGSLSHSVTVTLTVN